MAKVTKTIKVKIDNPNKGKQEALQSTLEILNRVLATFLDFTLAHTFLLTQTKEVVEKQIKTRKLKNQEILTEIEKRTLKTKAHQYTEIDIKTIYPNLPTSFRRSCINTSTGMCRSYLSNLVSWQSRSKIKKSKNPPAPPTPKNLPTFYSGTYEIELLDIQNQFVRLKVYSQRARCDASVRRRLLQRSTTPSTGEWVFINYPIKIGKKEFQILQSGEWKILSPTLVPKKKKGRIEWYLHIPVEKVVNVKKIEEQKKENKNLTTLSVDMGLKHIAVITVRKNNKIVFVKFFRCEKISAHRLRHLEKIFQKQKNSGKSIKGQRSNKQLWEHIGEMNDAHAHLVSREIVDKALEYGVDVIIIEHLRKFRNKKGERKSKKFNRKCTYWLKGKLEFNLRYKALEHGILVKSVNPAFTSQICNKCGGFGERFSNNSLFRCFYCGYCANADFNASVNLHKVFWDTFPLSKRKKKLQAGFSPQITIKKPTRKGKVAHSSVF
jgi:IS605 OrfB family transposase